MMEKMLDGIGKIVEGYNSVTSALENQRVIEIYVKEKKLQSGKIKDLTELADKRKIDIRVIKDNKNKSEKEIRKILKEYDIDLLILARYMQILSNKMSHDFFGKIINIHHSFLPSFKGAKPYHQAYEKGVKILGATAHYVSSKLDEGPIIDQSVERVDHAMTPKDLELIGRDLESITLARAVKYHIERRIFINNSKTVIFN